MPPPQTPFPERARDFKNLQPFLAPLLLFWEKGLGDEGKKIGQSIRIQPEEHLNFELVILNFALLRSFSGHVYSLSV
jgi:hypothetical protein